MKVNLIRKSLFIYIYILVFIIWLMLSRDQHHEVKLGITLFSLLAYIVTLVWMIQSYRSIKGKHRYFWLFFSMGIGFLFLSKIVPIYHQIQIGMIPRSPLEETIRIIGYLFFFIGFIFQMKVFKDTLPMIRYLLNILIVIIAVYSVSWHFIVHPMLERHAEITHLGSLLSSIYHVLNISLVFAAVCLIFMTKHKISLFFITAGFLIQVIGDFFYTNHFMPFGDWFYLLWPISSLLMGLGAVYSRKYPLVGKEEDSLEYRRDYLPLISGSILLIFTFYNQINETNVLQTGLHLTVIFVLLQQVITTIENKRMFTKLKLLAYSDGYIHQEKQKRKHQDKTEMSRLLQKIENIAHYDQLTKLPNRTLFQIRMEQMLKQVKKNKTKFSLFYIDIDRFKYVNDSLGHDCGDLLLEQVAMRLKNSVDEAATVARIGGDEFAIILEQSEMNRLEQVAIQILQQFDTSFPIQSNELYMTPSIGISIYPDGGKTIHDLLKSADAAMFLAKEEGKNTFRFFNHRLNELMLKKIQIETRLRRALDEKRFTLFYQPQMDLRTEKMIGVEALIRWNDPELGMVSPVDFIPIAEETGLIEQIGHWVLKTACQQLKDWQQSGIGDVTVAVNVSLRQFQNPNFTKELRDILSETGLSAKFLKIEITESTLQDIKKTLTILNDLKSLGIQIAIDDFGTGYSSLSYLKNLPVSCLKIDKSFIDELSVNPTSPIVKTIIDMGQNMNFTVIAEGVETAEHVTFLRKNNCFIGQGYFFSKPVPGIEMEKLIRKEYVGAWAGAF